MPSGPVPFRVPETCVCPRALRAALAALALWLPAIAYGGSVPLHLQEMPEEPPSVSFPRDVEPIFDNYCWCHVHGNRTAGLDLTPSRAYLNIVNVRSGEARGVDLIEPGDPERSYIYRKITNTQFDVGGGGTEMPADGPLTAEQIEVIRLWIAQGAEEE